jgi:hypothetical protein
MLEESMIGMAEWGNNPLPHIVARNGSNDEANHHLEGWLRLHTRLHGYDVWRKHSNISLFAEGKILPFYRMAHLCGMILN